MFLVRFGAPGVGVHIESGDASCPSETVAPQTPAAEADSEAAAPAEAEVSLWRVAVFELVVLAFWCEAV